MVQEHRTRRVRGADASGCGRGEDHCVALYQTLAAHSLSGLESAGLMLAAAGKVSAKLGLSE